MYADALSTVSTRYAKEIQTDEFGCGLDGVLASRADDLFGIINGIDYAVWDPSTDPLIPATYSPDDTAAVARGAGAKVASLSHCGGIGQVAGKS